MRRLTFSKAKNIGIRACIGRLGKDFYRQYRETGAFAYGKVDNKVFCFVGVDPDIESRPYPEKGILLTSDPADRFPYSASCLVNRWSGKCEFLECYLPEEPQSPKVAQS